MFPTGRNGPLTQSRYTVLPNVWAKGSRRKTNTCSGFSRNLLNRRPVVTHMQKAMSSCERVTHT